MAIRKRPSGRYQVYWQNPFTGKRESETVDTEAEAKKLSAFVNYRLQFDRESFHRPDEKKEVRQKTVDDVFLAYLKEKQFPLKAVAWQMDCMKTALRLVGQKGIENVTTEDIQSVLDAEKVKGVKSTTCRHRLKALKTLLLWSYRKGIIKAVPLFPELPHGQYEKFVPPTAEEISAMLAVAPSRIQRVIILGSQFGLRIGKSEAFRLRWSDIDLARRVIRVQAAKKNLSEPWREVPIRSSLLPLLEIWAWEDGVKPNNVAKLFVVSYNGKPVSTIKRVWTQVLKAAGIYRRIRPYNLRHAFATELLAEGVDVGTVAKLMGHTSPTMVLQHYQHVLTRQKIAAVESLPHVPESMCLKKNGSLPVQ